MKCATKLQTFVGVMTLGSFHVNTQHSNTAFPPPEHPSFCPFNSSLSLSLSIMIKTWRADASGTSRRSGPSPIPMSEENVQHMELLTRAVMGSLDNPVGEIAKYAIMALIREKCDKARVIDALLEGKWGTLKLN